MTTHHDTTTVFTNSAAPGAHHADRPAGIDPNRDTRRNRRRTLNLLLCGATVAGLALTTLTCRSDPSGVGTDDAVGVRTAQTGNGKLTQIAVGPQPSTEHTHPTPTTTSQDPTTPPTHVHPIEPPRTETEVCDTLFDAWTSADRNWAADVATAEVLDVIFSRPYQPHTGTNPPGYNHLSHSICELTNQSEDHRNTALVFFDTDPDGNAVALQARWDDPAPQPSVGDVCGATWEIWLRDDRTAAVEMLGDALAAKLFEVHPLDRIATSEAPDGDCRFDVRTALKQYRANVSIIDATDGARVTDVTWTELGDIYPRSSSEFCAALYWAWYGLDAHAAMTYATPTAHDALFSRTERGPLPKNAFSTNGYDRCYVPTHAGHIAEVILDGGDDGDPLKAIDAIWYTESEFFADPNRAAGYQSGLH